MYVNLVYPDPTCGRMMVSRQRRQDQFSGTPSAGIRLLGVLAAQWGRFLLPGKECSGGRGGVSSIIPNAVL